MAGVIRLGWKNFEERIRLDAMGRVKRGELSVVAASELMGMGIARRSPGDGLLHHSDRGVQYASDDYVHLLQSHKMEISMSGKGDCWDNAAMESFWATLKTELVYHEHYATHAQARAWHLVLRSPWRSITRRLEPCKYQSISCRKCRTSTSDS